MQSDQTQLTDVIYNGATQCFEALVTLRTAGVERRYACAINAPITTTFDDAAAGLAKQAHLLDETRRGLHSARVTAPPRAAKAPTAFDTSRWLRALLVPTDRATA